MTAPIVQTWEKDLTKYASALQALAAGRSNAGVSVTLAANAASTVVAAENCGEDSAPLPIATSANAAAELGNGTMYVSSVGRGTFTITHANNAQTDRTFLFVCLG